MRAMGYQAEKAIIHTGLENPLRIRLSIQLTPTQGTKAPNEHERLYRNAIIHVIYDMDVSFADIAYRDLQAERCSAAYAAQILAP